MKFNLKVLAAAALLATAGSSFAAISISSDPAGADVTFQAYDFGAGVGYVLDTNIKYQQLTGANGAFSFSLDLDNSTAWGQFLAASAGAGAASTGVQWLTVSGNSVTAVSPGQGILVGNSALSTTSPNIPAAKLATLRAKFNTGATAGNSAVGNTDNGVFINDGTGTIGGLWGLDGKAADNSAWNLTQSYSPTVASAQNLFRYITAAQSIGTFVGTSTLSVGNVLTVAAPVPEPGTYALMFAGLMTLGAVARRRGRR